MKCPDCGYISKGKVKYCRRCGSHLSQLHNRSIFCTECGKELNQREKYCTNCGTEQTEVSNNKRKSDRQQEKSTFTKKFLIFLVSALIIVSLIAWMNKPEPRKAEQAGLSILSDPVLEAAVLKIASLFRCSCGSCGEKPLEECDCETAIAERQFILDALKRGDNENEIIASVNAKYGWIETDIQ